MTEIVSSRRRAGSGRAVPSRRRVLLAVDGGNTKTLAVVVEAGGRVVGAARGGPTDIYGAPAADAIDGILATARAALAAAGLSESAVVAAAYGLAGADWPEDHAYLRAALELRFGAAAPPLVVNDGIGALWTGPKDGKGVAASCGTYFAVGASGPRGDWHAGFWAQRAGAVPLGEDALRAIYAADLGIRPATSITEPVLALFDCRTVEDLLHAFTSRTRRPRTEMGAIAPLVLDEAARGDAVALDLVRSHADAIAATVSVAALKVGLEREYVLVLGGGVLRHPSDVLRELIVVSLPGARPVCPGIEPVAGVALVGARTRGFPIDRDRLFASLPCATHARVSDRSRPPLRFVSLCNARGRDSRLRQGSR